MLPHFFDLVGRYDNSVLHLLSLLEMRPSSVFSPAAAETSNVKPREITDG